MPITTGQIIKSYRILETTGSGGMSNVYLALDQKLKRKVAVKVLHPYLLSSVEAKQRFKREALSTAQIDHPHVVRVYDYLEEPDFTAIVMEYVPGTNMERIVRNKGPQPFRTTLWVMHKVVVALKQAHQKGIIHRDIKPSNILVRFDNQVMLSDFGLAFHVEDTHLTMEGTVAGTPQFMSPEQISGKKMQYNSDIYSWAVTFCYLIQGKIPYRTTEFTELVQAVKSGQVVLDHDLQRRMPASAVALLEQCLLFESNQRIQDGEHLLSRLETLFESSQLNLTPCLQTQVQPVVHTPMDSNKTMTVTFGRRSAKRAWKLAAGVVAVFAVSLGIKQIVNVSQPLKERAILQNDTDKNATSEGKEQNPATALAVNETHQPRAKPTIPILVAPAKKRRTTTLQPKLLQDSSPAAMQDSGNVHVYTHPWAVVYVNGDSVAMTPLKKGQTIRLPAGKHKLQMKNPYFEPLEDTVEVLANRVIFKRYQLGKPKTNR